MLNRLKTVKEYRGAMKNKDLFAEFAVLILKELFDSFPIAITLDKERHLGDVIDYPEQPVRSYLGFPGAGVYVGPNLDFVFDEKQRQELWSCYDWESCETNTGLVATSSG